MAGIALLSLVVIVIIAFIKKINIGVLGYGMALIVGVYVAGMSGSDVIAGFPTSLCVKLIGISFFFTIAVQNGTMENLAHLLGRAAGKKRKLVPIIVYFGSCILVAFLGGVAGISIIAPLAMALAKEKKVDAYLISIALGLAGSASALNPITTNGVIWAGIVSEFPEPVSIWPVCFHIFVSCTLCFFILYFVGGGLKLKDEEGHVEMEKVVFNGMQKLTLGAIVVWLLLVALLGVDAGLAGFTVGAVLLVLNACDHSKVVSHMSWGVILMIGGVGTLVNVIKAAGGIDAAVDFLSSVMTAKTAPALMCLMGGIMSSVSSATGVVMPTLMPMAPDLSASLGAGTALIGPLLSGIIVGSHLVPVSPLSTIGGICMATCSEETDKNVLFRKLLISAVVVVIIGTLISLTGFLSLGY